MDNESLTQALQRQFAFTKQPTTLETLFAHNLGVPANGGALLPVAELHRGTRPLGAKFVPEEWLDVPSRLAYFVYGRSLSILAAIGLQSREDLRVEVSVYPMVNSPEVADAVAVLSKWLEDTLCVDAVVASSTDEKKLWENAGFADHVFKAPQTRNIGSAMILTAGPSISNREAVYATEAAKYGWNKEWSKYLTRFESEFASFVGAKHAMACSSCTGALTIALTALEIGPGDEVIVPDLTWVATANAVRYVGATPVFADVELDTWNMDPRSVESLITPRTKAIMPVHMYGHPARMDVLMRLARGRGLYVVEDAAPAIGAEWQGQRCGSFGDFAAFSFQGAKLLVTGEGGMLVCRNADLYQKAFKIWDQGRNPSRAFWIDEHGLKYKMANIQAALGLAQLERCTELVAMKRRLFSWYAEGLGSLKSVRLNHEVPGASSIYWMSSIFVDEAAPLSRDALMQELKKRNIDTRPVFPAISQYPIWPRKSEPQPTALRIGRQAINLPSGVCLRREQVDYVCRNVRELLKA